jgi:hypothetical protein
VQETGEAVAEIQPMEQPHFEQWVEHWQRGYEALRRNYPKEK